MSIREEQLHPIFQKQIDAILQEIDSALRGEPAGFAGDFFRTVRDNTDVIRWRSYLWNLDRSGPLEQTAWIWNCVNTFKTGTTEQADLEGLGGPEKDYTVSVLREAMPPSFAGYVAKVITELFEDEHGEVALDWLQESGVALADVPTQIIREALENGIAVNALRT